MNPIDRIQEIVKEVKSGKSDIRLFYDFYFENAVLISPENFSIVYELSKEFSAINKHSDAWHSLLEVLYHTFHPSSSLAYDMVERAFVKFKEVNDEEGIGAVHAVHAIFLKNLGQLDKAQVALQETFRLILPGSYYNYFLLISYYQAGEIHHMMKDYDVAIDFFNKMVDNTADNVTLSTRALNALGTIYSEQGDFTKADGYYSLALEKIERSNNQMLRSKIYADIANNHSAKGDYDQSFEWHNKSIALREQHLLKNPLITSYADLANLFVRLKKCDEALEYAHKAEQLALELNIIIKLHSIYKTLADCYEMKGDDKTALSYYKKYQQVKDEVLSQENARKIKQLNMRFEMDSMQKEKELFTLKNVVLKNALDEIEASVRYARRIQDTILPTAKNVKHFLPDSFVLYLPKDIVAGDFYFVEYSAATNTLVVAVADCTGHGVPGAMVSVICNNHLNRNLHEHKITDPGEILNRTRESIIREFDRGDSDVQDGMDVSLISWKKEVVINQKSVNLLLQWSGANNPLWIVRGTDFIEYKADKQPVGKFDNATPFTTHQVEVQKGDMLYLFSDGYQDQFGGEQGKKFKASQLKEFLLAIATKSTDEQHQLLKQRFEAWKGELEQVDDVCIIGIRI